MNIMNIVKKKAKGRVIKKKYKVLIALFIIFSIIINVTGLYMGNIYYQKVCKLNINPATTGLDYYKSSFDYNTTA